MSNTNKKNSNLSAARTAKNDEFYTMLQDVEKELSNYKRHFRGKVVLCNCDDPEWSNIFRYFALNFSHLGLKKLISTHYEQGGRSYKLEITGDMNGDGRVDDKDVVRTELQGDGDFRSPECVELLAEADVVVTNPPFSLFREYISLLVEHDKKFLVIGNKNAITYKEVFPLIQANKLWLGNTSPADFIQPEGDQKKQMAGLCCWFTNLNHKRRKEGVLLFRRKRDLEYPKYDGYNIINVSKTADIPKDHKGIMGVPITFLTKYCPDQFEILGIANNARWIGDVECITRIDGKSIYNRILIRRK